MARTDLSVDLKRLFEVRVGDRSPRSVKRLLQKLHDQQVAEGREGFLVRLFAKETSRESTKPRGTAWVNMVALRAVCPTMDMVALVARVEQLVEDQATLREDIAELTEQQSTDRKHLNALKGEVHHHVMGAVNVLGQELAAVTKKLERLALAFAGSTRAA